MEAMEELVELSESMRQAAAVLADEDVRSSTFLNVVALGNVGAGKSAVLNSLIGHPVLPTGENGATRAPITIDLARDTSLSSKAILLPIDNKSQSVSAGALRHSLQDRLSKVSSGRSRDEKIYLKLRTSTAPPLKLIDLPGVLEQRIVDDSLLSECLQHNDAILLVIVPAARAPEISSSRALMIAKEYDSQGTRTVGIVSKIDQAASDSKLTRQLSIHDNRAATIAASSWCNGSIAVDSSPRARGDEWRSAFDAAANGPLESSR